MGAETSSPQGYCRREVQGIVSFEGLLFYQVSSHLGHFGVNGNLEITPPVGLKNRNPFFVFRRCKRLFPEPSGKSRSGFFKSEITEATSSDP
jgi:hypothetical protein